MGRKKEPIGPADVGGFKAPPGSEPVGAPKVRSATDLAGDPVPAKLPSREWFKCFKLRGLRRRWNSFMFHYEHYVALLVVTGAALGAGLAVNHYFAGGVIPEVTFPGVLCFLEMLAAPAATMFTFFSLILIAFWRVDALQSPSKVLGGIVAASTLASWVAPVLLAIAIGCTREIHWVQVVANGLLAIGGVIVMLWFVGLIRDSVRDRRAARAEKQARDAERRKPVYLRMCEGVISVHRGSGGVPIGAGGPSFEISIGGSLGVINAHGWELEHRGDELHLVDPEGVSFALGSFRVLVAQIVGNSRHRYMHAHESNWSSWFLAFDALAYPSWDARIRAMYKAERSIPGHQERAQEVQERLEAQTREWSLLLEAHVGILADVRQALIDSRQEARSKKLRKLRELVEDALMQYIVESNPLWHKINHARVAAAEERRKRAAKRQPAAAQPA